MHRTLIRLVATLLAALPLFSMGCRSASYAERGAGLGALAGAATGAAIGEHNGSAAAGAVLGSAVGAITGAAMGDAVDYEVAREQALIEQRLGRRMASAVTIDDVIAMTHAGLSSEIMKAHIRNKGVAQPLEVPDLITLQNAKVPGDVIQAMQSTGPPDNVAPARFAGAAPRPVIVEEHYYSPPLFYGPRYPRAYCPPPVRHHHPRAGFHFSIRN